jgi:hypothetical protein
MSSNISKIGCVTSALAKDAGFISFSDIKPVGSIEECLSKADDHGKLCSDNDPNSTDEKCHFVAYKDGNHSDLLREASSEYEKKEFSFGDKKKYINNSLQLFHDIWLSYSETERKDQLSGNQLFLNNFAPWIKESKGQITDYMKWFYDNVTTDIKSISANKQKNKCWIGGKNVLKYKDYTHFIDNIDNLTDKISQCKDKDYALYIVPGTEGDNYTERINKLYNQQAIDAQQLADKASKKASSSAAMARFINNSGRKNIALFDLLNEAHATKSKVEFDLATHDKKKDITSKLNKIMDNDKYIKKIKDLTSISANAINRNIDFVKDKQHVADKMASDLQTLNWSLKESENKEVLQNKITTTLGIIIMLFAGLCVGLIVYYLIDGIPGTAGGIKKKSNKNMLNNIFGFNKVSTTSSNKKGLNSLFF